ncbi:MAG: alpha/beta hydrolase fold domain-containing protein [Actinomycetes bacterium]
MSSDRDVLDRPAPPPDKTLAYGPLAEHVVDLRLPAQATRPVPLVVVVHGGFWMAEYDRAHAGPQSAGLAEAGYVVATPEYRRVSRRGGGWPETFDDVALLADTVPGLARQALGDRVDTARTVLVGHSAGGHLAAWASSRHRLPDTLPWHLPARPPLAGVVSLAGVLDLVEADRLGLGGHAARQLIGGSPRRHRERYAVASPAALLPTGGRCVLVHGSVDELVPVEISRTYARDAAAAGDDAVLHELDGVGHFALIDPLSAAWPAVLDAIALLASP